VRNCGLHAHLGWDTSDGLLGGQKQRPQFVHERCGAVFVHKAEERHLHLLRVGDLPERQLELERVRPVRLLQLVDLSGL
jgi:hypothetical protein